MKVNGLTKTIGLIGCPVEHTLSPMIHNHLSEVCGDNYVYLPFHVEKDNVEAAVKGSKALSVQGLNVTVPHKQAVMPYLVDIDEAARVIGAVNTLVPVDGGYKGYNTDMEGLRQAIHSEHIALQGRTVVILGAGGASKAVVYMCMLEGAKKVYLLNRTVNKAEEIAIAMNAHFGKGDVIVPMALEAYGDIHENDMIVFQATSIGLAPNVDDVVLSDVSFYKKVAVGVDLIYNPAETQFMKLVKAAGGVAYNGLKMLLYQGVIAYGYWTNRSFESLQPYCNEIYEKMYHSIHKLDNIVLIGFMGSGKSTVGMALAEKMGFAFLDTDAYIEKKAGMSISEIFENHGEGYFRELETNVIRELMETTNHTVFSTGGGMPLRDENASLLRLLGTTVYLQASAKETYERVKDDDKRPLLQCEDPYGRIVALLEERRPLYERASHLCIQTDGKTVESIVDEVIKQMEDLV